MLVCDALDERDFLAKKISDAIKTFKPCAVKRKMDKNLSDGSSVEDFTEKVKRDFQSIQDMIARHKRINRALVLSNATTKIKIKCINEELTIAEAISLRKATNEGTNSQLIAVMMRSFNDAKQNLDILNRKKDQMDEKYKDTFANSDKAITDDDIKNIEALTDRYTPELVDPVNCAEKLKELDEQESLILKEIESAIKVSNATTTIEF